MTEKSIPQLTPEAIYWKRVLGDRYDEVLSKAIRQSRLKPESGQAKPEVRPMGVEGSPSPEYLERVDKLDEAVKQCASLSNRCEGIRSPTQAHYYASLLFTSLCVRSWSLALLTPFSRFSQGNFKHWDHMTIAGIARSILEYRLAFFYLCAQKCSPEEWNCRLIVLHLHDCQSRVRLLADSPPEDEDVARREEQFGELQARLTSNPHFATLSEKRQAALLRGRDAFIYSLEEVAVHAGISLQDYHWQNRLFSNKFHAFPMAFYRMAELDRGRGIHSEAEETQVSYSISTATSHLNAARIEMEALFGGLTTALQTPKEK
jgi:hypothetical protein